MITPYDMAITVARIAKLDRSLIEPVTADLFPEMVRRAKKSGLLIDKAINLLGYQPHKFEDGVKLSFAIKP
jgi:dTDP-4-dehydrorhamnose reductase